MNSFEGKLAVVTGGASGIGKIMARLLLELKAKVIIWDIDQLKLSATVAELRRYGSIFSYKVDVSETQQVISTAELIKTEHGVVSILINNAGIVVGKHFHEHTEEDIVRTMNINSNAPMVITRIFIKDMMAQNNGYICNIASSAGLISNPKMSVYAASKWAAVGWSDSVRLEMKELKKDIHVTTIMPYYINTGMFDGVESRIPILDPEVAAKTIIDAFLAKKRMVTVPGYLYRLTRLGQGLLSINGFDFVAGKILGIYKTMAHFTGHKK